jgi:hypothetical protein
MGSALAIRRNTGRKVGVAVLLLVAGGIFCDTSFYGIRPGPSFIARLQSGDVTSQDVERVEILRFDPRGGWPFRESDYEKLERLAITERRKVEALLAVLKTDSTFGIQQRDHPRSLHYGILRVKSRGGEHFYFYYEIGRDATGDFAVINANSAYGTNPNGAQRYVGTRIVDLLRRDDPWFGTIR